jgi:hypothetical protein
MRKHTKTESGKDEEWEKFKSLLVRSMQNSMTDFTIKKYCLLNSGYILTCQRYVCYKRTPATYIHNYLRTVYQFSSLL